MPRLEPSSLPPAGRPCLHDSGHEDYRYVASRSPSPQRRLQTVQWYQPSPNYFAQKPPRLEAHTNPTSPTRKHFYVGDVPGASPASRPGLTFQTHASPEPCIPVPNNSSSCERECPRGFPSPDRIVNPLEPHYVWDRAAAPLLSVPGEPQLRSSRPHVVDVWDIPGAQPARMKMRPRTVHASLDYSDVSKVPTSPIKHKLLKQGRPQREPPDTRQLGMWGTCGDTGNLLGTHRPPTNPLRPQYSVHGRVVFDDYAKMPRLFTASPEATVPAGKHLASEAGSPIRAAPPVPAAKPAGSPAQGMVEAMRVLGLASNQNARSPQRIGHGRNLTNVHVRKPCEVVPIHV